jgi:hypothetical protein
MPLLTRFALLMSLLPFTVIHSGQAFAVAPIPDASPAATAASYDYPYSDPYRATMTAALLGTKRVKPKMVRVAPLPDRDDIQFLKGRATEFSVAVFAQRGPAPLAFIIPGYGASQFSGVAWFLADRLHALGRSVIVLPNPSFWKFVLAQSRVPVPGLVPEETEDLKRVLRAAEGAARSAAGLQVSSRELLGFSLGAVHAAQVWRADQARREFGFSRMLMINPPLSLEYSIRTLDSMADVVRRWTPRERRDIESRAFGYADEMMEVARDGGNLLEWFDREVHFTASEMQFLIAGIYRESLADSIFVSQQLHDLGFLTIPSTPELWRRRRREIAKYNFMSYVRVAAFPFWSETERYAGATMNRFLGLGDLWPQIRTLSADPRVFIMHNRDDFLIPDGSATRLKAAFGGRAFIYPRGGHMGNIWFEKNQKDLASVFR